MRPLTDLSGCCWSRGGCLHNSHTGTRWHILPAAAAAVAELMILLRNEKNTLLLCAHDSAPLCEAERHGRHSAVSSLASRRGATHEKSDNECVIVRRVEDAYRKKERKKNTAGTFVLADKVVSPLVMLQVNIHVHSGTYLVKVVWGEKTSADTESLGLKLKERKHFEEFKTCLGGKVEDSRKPQSATGVCDSFALPRGYI